MKGVAVCIALSAPLWAIGAAPAAPDPVAAAKAPFEALKVSAELARLGHQHRDAWALAMAARLRLQSHEQAVERSPLGAAKEASQPMEPLAAGWLDEAESLGEADAQLLAFTRDVRSTTYKGRTGGPKVSTALLNGGGSHRYAEPFQAGSPAVVYLEGDGDSDLELVVSAPSGAPDCTDRSPGDIKLCAWRPSVTGLYSVQVANRGSIANKYAFGTN